MGGVTGRSKREIRSSILCGRIRSQWEGVGWLKAHNRNPSTPVQPGDQSGRPSCSETALTGRPQLTSPQSEEGGPFLTLQKGREKGKEDAGQRISLVHNNVLLVRVLLVLLLLLLLLLAILAILAFVVLPLLWGENVSESHERKQGKRENKPSFPTSPPSPCQPSRTSQASPAWVSWVSWEPPWEPPWEPRQQPLHWRPYEKKKKV